MKSLRHINRRGQALLEWVIVLVGTTLILSTTLFFTKQAFHATLAQTWTLFAARAKLSRVELGTPRGVRIHLYRHRNQVVATSGFGAAKIQAKVSVPEKKDSLASSFWSVFYR